MKSRDGFEEVNRELREGAWRDDPVSRRAMLQALGLTAAGLAAGTTVGLRGALGAGKTCGACGVDNAAEARFCNRCGAELAVAPATAPAAAVFRFAA